MIPETDNSDPLGITGDFRARPYPPLPRPILEKIGKSTGVNYIHRGFRVSSRSMLIPAPESARNVEATEAHKLRLDKLIITPLSCRNNISGLEQGDNKNSRIWKNMPDVLPSSG